MTIRCRACGTWLKLEPMPKQCPVCGEKIEHEPDQETKEISISEETKERG